VVALPIAKVAKKISISSAPVNENPQEATNRVQTYRLALPRGGSQSGAERREHGGHENVPAAVLQGFCLSPVASEHQGGSRVSHEP